jgi:uncharacterized protein
MKPVASQCEESVLRIDCEGTALWGVCAAPKFRASATPLGTGVAEPSASDTGVVVIVGGPQYRAGSHRQFVLTARHLAGQGFSVLRFDYRGMGDSAGDLGHFEQVSGDVRAAIDALLKHQPHLKRVVLWGLCDGAAAALLYHFHERDDRLAGMVLLNPWVRSATTQAATRVKHYYVERLTSGAFWRKLLTGKVAVAALTELASSLRLMILGQGTEQISGQQLKTFQGRMAAAWNDFDRPLLLVLSGNDHTAREFEEACATQAAWSGALDRPTVTRYDAPTADHTFSHSAARLELDRRTANWLRESGL